MLLTFAHFASARWSAKTVRRITGQFTTFPTARG